MSDLRRRRLLGAAAGTATLAVPGLALPRPALAQATTSRAAPVRIAVVAVLTGPQAALGQQIRDGFALGVRRLDNRLGGRPAAITVIDDELKPDVAVSRVRAAIERGEADFVVGVAFSNILQAIVRPVTESGAFLISTNAGPSTLAGRGCHRNLFAASYNNDQVHAVMGQVAQDEGYRRVLVLTPNYQAGRDAVAGFRSRFRGEVVDELYVPLTQLDFSAELTRIAGAKPDAVFTFMPGGLGVNLVKQYRQAGLAGIPFLSTFTVDEATLPAQGDAAEGFYSGADWAPNLDNPANRAFVPAFEAAYGYIPALYAAQSYDAANLLDGAIARVGGDLGDKDALRDAIRAAPFSSVRGGFRFGTNQFPVQDFWLCRVARRADGKLWTQTVRRVLEADVDPYAASCRMG